MVHQSKSKYHEPCLQSVLWRSWEHTQCKAPYHCLVIIVVIWQIDHWCTLVPEPDYDSVQCDTVCFSMCTGNFILINTGEVFREVHLHHHCFGICCCHSQSACIIRFRLQLVNKVPTQQKICEQVLKSWQQVFKGVFLFLFFLSDRPCLLPTDTIWLLL